jgi:hypothetical protein
MKTTHVVTGMRLCWILAAGGVAGALSAEVAPVNRTPYISTYYIQPKVNLGDPAIIDYYVTDFDHKEYLDDDASERFVIDYWVNGVKGVLTNVPAGDRSLNLGVLPKGNVLFAFQATDRLGIKSHRLYQEFRVVDPAAEAIQPGEVLHPDLAAFNISSNDTAPVATTAGLTALIKWASTNGYRKVVLPQGRYRIHESNTVQMATGVTLDMNGSTFKLNPNALAKALMLEFVDCVDAHVINGVFEGDLLEHDFVNAPNNSEWVHALSIAQGSEYCSVENVTITNVTGYGTCSNHRHSYDSPVEIGKRFAPGDVDAQGALVASTIRTTNTNLIDVAKFLSSYGFIQLGVYLGYQGNPSGHWVYRAHFYDAGRNYLESIEGYMYRRLYPPANARYARFTLYGTSQPETLNVYNFRSPYNCAYRNIRHVNIRCVGMALCGLNNFLVEGCRFDNCGWASARCAFDAEDGWDLMQDLTFRNNVFGANPANEYLTCAGHNFVMENNVMKAYMWDRSKNFVFRANTLKSAVYRFGSLLRSGYARIAGNDNQGKTTLILDTTLPDKRHYVRDESYTNGVTGPTGGWLGFRRCAITGGAMNAHAVQCSLLNVTNTGGAFGIVDSVVSNSTLKQSQLTVARVEGSQVVNSRLHVQGGMIIATSNQLINTDCAVTGDWNTNHVFCLTGNRIDIPKATFLTVGNTFKQMLFTNNVVNATAAGFNFVTLSNPMNSGAGSLSNMWVCFTGNTFNGNGGLVLKSSAPAAASRLFVDFHYNVYNNLALHATALANKANVILSVRPALPTELSVTLTADVIPENAGAGAITVTVTRYMNTAEALTVHLASSDSALFSVPATVVIPAGQTSVTFTLDMIDNADQAGHQSESVTASADGFTAGSAALVVHDDELASLFLATAGSPFQLAEGAATNYTVALGTIPTAPVTVTLVPQAPLLVSPATLTFSVADWNIPQTVALTHPDTDTLADPPRLRAIAHTLASTDAAYDALAVDPLAVAISDNDLPTLTLTAAATSVSEAAGTAATTVILYRNTPATNALAVVMTSSLPETLHLDSPATIPLGEGSVTLAVGALDDAVVEPDALVTVSATAAGFVGDAVVIEVTDDDTPPIAITNTIPYAESFETLAEGAPLLPGRGWYAGTTQAGVVVRDTYAYSRALPLATTHTQYALISETVTNRIAHAGSQPTWIDMMIAPRLGEPDAGVGEAETGIFFNDSGHLMLFHRDLAGGTNRWTELEHPAVATGTWVRLTAALDYATEDPVHPGIRYLRLFLDGRAISSGAAYTDNDGSGLPGGFWFAIPRPSPAPVGEISFHSGPCNLDDLTVTTQPPRTPGGTPWSWLARYGLTADDDASDNDLDGFTAQAEHIAETDPDDPDSFFKILAIDADPADAARVGFPSAPGRLYTLEGRSSLESASWLPLGEMTDVPGTGAMLWLRDTNAAPTRFFRVKVRLGE